MQRALFLLALVLVSAVACDYRGTPMPVGLVFRTEAREAQHPLDCFGVYAIDRDGPVIAVYAAATSDAPATLSTYRYPSGALVETLKDWDAFHRQIELAPLAEEASRRFDFDADGRVDTIEIGQGTEFGVIRVRSGGDGHVLFEHDDPIEYECSDRAIPLGDLDGDGYSELAVLHPRKDRSRYDEHLWDWIFGVESSITIVSGSRIER